MQVLLLTRHCQVEVISILKENPKEEEQADSSAGYLVAIARYRLFCKKNVIQRKKNRWPLVLNVFSVGQIFESTGQSMMRF